MPTVTVSGRTARSLYRNISDGICNGNIPMMPRYSTMTNKDYRTEIHNVCFNVIWAISGGEPMRLFDEDGTIKYCMYIHHNYVFADIIIPQKCKNCNFYILIC